jgi:uncharacterized protein YbjQ (UPF0145 family)
LHAPSGGFYLKLKCPFRQLCTIFCETCLAAKKQERIAPCGAGDRRAPDFMAADAAVTTKKERMKMATNDSGITLSNIEHFPGYTIVQHLGLVQGSTVRAKHVGRDIMAGLKNIVGGELKGYTELLNESRREALSRMQEQARAVGANAVINVRFSTANITAGAAEILAYGTAVVIKRGE